MSGDNEDIELDNFRCNFVITVII